MIHTLQALYDDNDLMETLQRYSPRWVGDNLHCGNYIVASVWPMNDRQFTWRTAWCSAHNIAETKEEGIQKCEVVVRNQREKAMTLSEAFDKILTEFETKAIGRGEALAKICQTHLSNRGGYRTDVPLSDVKAILKREEVK